MDVKKWLSYIKFNEQYWKYEFEIWFIKKFFDFIYINDWNKYETYWTLKNSEFDKDFEFKNIVVGITYLQNKIILNFIDLETLKSEIYIANCISFKSIPYKWKSINIIIYNEEWIIWYKICNLDYELIIETVDTDNKIIIKNKIFGTIIYKFTLTSDNNYCSKDVSSPKSKNYFDLYFFNNSFDDKLINLLSTYDWKYSILKLYDNVLLPNIMIRYYFNDFEKISNDELFNIVLCYNSVDILVNTYWEKNQLLNLYETIPLWSIELKNLDFKIPDNIYKFDIRFRKFMIKFNQLRFWLFRLYEYKKSINNISKIKTDNSHITLAIERMNLNIKPIDDLISDYENKLLIIVNNIF